MKTPLVSVSLPAYNRAQVIGPSIQSILDQSLRDFELIIVDDGSDDNLEEVIKSFNDPRVRFVRHKENKGPYAARNTGIRESRGTYLAFQDSDDIWHPKILEEAVALLADSSSSVGGVYSRWRKIFLDGSVSNIPPLDYSHATSGWLVKNFLRADYFITMQALVIKKSAVETCGLFDESFPVFGDADFCIRFSTRFELIFNPHVRVTIPLSKDSISRNTRKRLVSREKIFLKYPDLYRRDSDIFAQNAYRLGKSFEGFGEKEKARTYLRMAAQTRPLNARYVISYLRALVRR